jgi:hypothetical protein
VKIDNEISDGNIINAFKENLREIITQNSPEGLPSIDRTDKTCKV